MGFLKGGEAYRAVSADAVNEVCSVNLTLPSMTQISVEWWLVDLSKLLTSKINMCSDCGENPSTWNNLPSVSSTNENLVGIFKSFTSRLMWHLLEEEELHSHLPPGPGNVLSLWPKWLKLHQVFWPLCLKRVTILNLNEIRLHSFCWGILCSLCAAKASILLDDLECWTMRLVSLSCYSLSKALFSSIKATPHPFCLMHLSPGSDLTPSCEVQACQPLCYDRDILVYLNWMVKSGERRQ